MTPSFPLGKYMCLQHMVQLGILNLCIRVGKQGILLGANGTLFGVQSVRY